jgi:hypothetical protein
MQYVDRRLFALLSLLFPFVDLHNQFHIDHVFPISRFTTQRLLKSGIPEATARAGRILNPSDKGVPCRVHLEGRCSRTFFLTKPPFLFTAAATI